MMVHLELNRNTQHRPTQNPSISLASKQTLHVQGKDL
jgi:hypothetical protein